MYANFHVEGTVATTTTTNDNPSESSDTYNFFLPQHYALPYLLADDDVEAEKNDDASATTTTVWIFHHRATAEVWATSVLHWYSITRRILNSFQIPYYYSEMEDSDTTVTTNDPDLPVQENEEETPDGRTGRRSLKKKRKKKKPKKTEEVLTMELLQHALDTTSVERIHNQTDHQRRFVELVAIHNFHQARLQQFVHDYNDQEKKKNTQLFLYDIDIDNAPDTPLQLARALGYVPSPEDDVDSETVAAIQHCWQHTYDTHQHDLDDDYLDFNLTTTFRASV